RAKRKRCRDVGSFYLTPKKARRPSIRPFFFTSRRRHTRSKRDWSSDVCSSDLFINGELEWICATNAFGMGIHKEDVRQVIHLHIPTTFANYVQEVGSAGRDGKQSAATLLYTEDDL